MRVHSLRPVTRRALLCLLGGVTFPAGLPADSPPLAEIPAPAYLLVET